MTKLNTAIISALIATAALAGTAVANEGEYYEGAQRDAAAVSKPGISYDHTGSVSRADPLRLPSGDSHVDRGDYYEGATRPV